MTYPEIPPPPRRTSQAEQLVECAGVSLFASPEGIAYAQIDLGSGAAQSVALRSSRFRDWLLARFYREYGIVPAVNAVSQAMRMFEANAHCAQDQEPKPIEQRLAIHRDLEGEEKPFSISGTRRAKSSKYLPMAGESQRSTMRSAKAAAFERSRHPSNPGRINPRSAIGSAPC